jgi:two-component system chemotaxis response regulator CheB
MELTVLIVDDSRIFRSIVEDSLKEEDDIKVIGSVRNGAKAIEFIRVNRPDVVTLDMEMPEMNGLETLRAIREINASQPFLPPIGVIMLSVFTRKGADSTMTALEEGAFDFIAKPEGKNVLENIQSLRRQLAAKIRFFASRRLATHLPNLSETRKTEISKIEIRPAPLANTHFRAILIGVSTGGPKALMTLLPALCERLDIPIFLVQHMPPTFTASLATSLDAKCAYTVIEARHNDRVQPRYAYIAPGGKHLMLRRHGDEIFTVINDQAPDNGCRPSVNVLFRSAPTVFGGDLIAVILTGMGADGSNAIGAIKRAGGHVIAQDEATSVVWGMPGSAVATGYVDQVLPLQDIPGAIFKQVLKFKE